jgi:hypothetical protein
MIDDVRNAVLAVANKNNYGYITPSDFNLYAQQAQLDVFEGYFQLYNDQIRKENARQSGTGYADLRQITEEVIDTFSTGQAAAFVSGSTFSVPANCYTLVNVLYGTKVAERLSLNKLNQLLASNLTAPTITYPGYTISGTTTGSPLALVQRLTMYPTTITSGVNLQYIRYPRIPKWTWLSFGANGDPIFNQGAADYVDFELPESDMPALIARILQYAGISIREGDVYQFGQATETETLQKERS